MSDSFNAPGSNRLSILPQGTTALLYLTVLMVAVAIGLGVYVVDMRAIAAATAAGYTPWQSVTLNDWGLIDPGHFGATAWMRFVPQQQLGVMFLPTPAIRAGCAFVPLLIGGVTALLTAQNWGELRHHQKHPGAGIAGLLLFFGAYAAFDSMPPGFVVDLSSQSLTQNGDSLPLAQITRFGTYVHIGRHNHGVDVNAYYGANETTLASFLFYNDANTLLTTVQGFVTSNGQAL